MGDEMENKINDNSKKIVQCDICQTIFTDRAEAKRDENCMAENHEHSVRKYKL